MPKTDVRGPITLVTFVALFVSRLLSIAADEPDPDQVWLAQLWTSDQMVAFINWPLCPFQIYLPVALWEYALYSTFRHVCEKMIYLAWGFKMVLDDLAIVIHFLQLESVTS